jgi:hypothetical protein
MKCALSIRHQPDLDYVVALQEVVADQLLLTERMPVSAGHRYCIDKIAGRADLLRLTDSTFERWFGQAQVLDAEKKRIWSRGGSIPSCTSPRTESSSSPSATPPQPTAPSGSSAAPAGAASAHKKPGKP